MRRRFGASSLCQRSTDPGHRPAAHCDSSPLAQRFAVGRDSVAALRETQPDPRLTRVSGSGVPRRPPRRQSPATAARAPTTAARSAIQSLRARDRRDATPAPRVKTRRRGPADASAQASTPGIRARGSAACLRVLATAPRANFEKRPCTAPLLPPAPAEHVYSSPTPGSARHRMAPALR